MVQRATHSGMGIGILSTEYIKYFMMQEVRVRFAGFGHEEDEWVNVKRRVRERSVPLEPSECDRLNVGDAVMCFRVSFLFSNFCYEK